MTIRDISVVTEGPQPNRISQSDVSEGCRACSEGVITRGFQPLVPGSNPGERTFKKRIQKPDNGWLNEDSLRIRMIMPILSQFQNNEPNIVRYFAWLADGNDAVSWMCI